MENHTTSKCEKYVCLSKVINIRAIFKPHGSLQLPWGLAIVLVVYILLGHSDYIPIHNTSV